MNYQNASLPSGAKLIGASPEMTEKNVLKAILAKHMAPKGKYACLLVESGALQFVWEDTQETFDVAPGHPLVITPERYHHVSINGPVKFKLEFYAVPGTMESDDSAIRPGEAFLKKSV